MPKRFAARHQVHIAELYLELIFELFLGDRIVNCADDSVHAGRTLPAPEFYLMLLSLA